jgi:ribosomal protein S18 acetylase RimI-like enzyme
MKIVPYSAAHFADVDTLWRICFPNDPRRNRAASAIPAKLALADGLFFVAEDADGRAIGTVMAGYDGHRGWLYAVAVHPDSRLAGIGTALVSHACDVLRERGCVKVNLQVREGNEPVARFYERLGFDREPRISMGRDLAR